MRPVLLALALAGALVCALPGAAASYDDGVCRAGAIGWANDPCAGRQWGLAKVRAPEAWRLSRRGGVVVAVVDTGADFRHPDLRPNLIAKAGSNLLRSTVSTCPFHATRPGHTRRAVARDDNGHGTHVAGTVAAVTGNGPGVAGWRRRRRCSR